MASGTHISWWRSAQGESPAGESERQLHTSCLGQWDRYLPSTSSLQCTWFLLQRNCGPSAGTSSFGMSGVNAHMLLGEPSQLDSDCSSPLITASCLLPWKRLRLWPAPFLHHLVHPLFNAAKTICRYAAAHSIGCSNWPGCK